MTLTVSAVYERGVLRPARPLPLEEGTNVEVTVEAPAGSSTELSEEEIYQRIAAAKSYHEWFELTKLLPADDGGLDIVKALNENRRLAGEMPLIPDEESQP